MLPAILSRRRFSELSEQEIIALAVSSEEDDARIYRSYAELLRAEFPDSAKMFDGMAEEETRFFGLKRECGLHEDFDK